MKEAVGNAMIFNIITTVLVLIILFLTASLSYSKAFRVKNNIINHIEKANTYNPTVRAAIDAQLRDIGYRVNKGNNNCVPKKANGQVLTPSSAGTYRYCVIRYSTSKGDYYAVTAYMYFDIPIISSLLEFPVYGESKVIYDL